MYSRHTHTDLLDVPGTCSHRETCQDQGQGYQGTQGAALLKGNSAPAPQGTQSTKGSSKGINRTQEDKRQGQAPT